MNPEHIQQLLEMLGALGDGAKEGFVYYLIALVTPKLLAISLGAMVALCAYKLINRVLINEGKSVMYRRRYESVCHALTVPTYSDRATVIAKIVKLQKGEVNG